MDELESLIGKSIHEIDNEILESFAEINVKAAILEYKYKNCGVRYPSNSFKLEEIDYDNPIGFDELFSFDKLFIFWHFNETITDLEIYDISQDRESLKEDYDLITDKIENGEAHNLRAGDTRLLGAKRLNEVIYLNNRKTNKREFVLKVIYLRKILNEISNFEY